MFYLLFMKIHWNWKRVFLFILGNPVGVVHCGPYNPSDDSKKTLRTRLVAIRSRSAPRGPSYVGAFWGNTILPMHSFLQQFSPSLLHLREGLKKLPPSLLRHFFALDIDLILPWFITISLLIKGHFDQQYESQTHISPKQHYRWEYARDYHYKEKKPSDY